MDKFISIKARRKGYNWVRFYESIRCRLKNEPKTVLLPIVAKAAFAKDFPNLNEFEVNYYYKQQCAMKEMYGIDSTIKFIN
jgi:hypothetical protein